MSCSMPGGGSLGGLGGTSGCESSKSISPSKVSVSRPRSLPVLQPESRYRLATRNTSPTNPEPGGNALGIGGGLSGGAVMVIGTRPLGATKDSVEGVPRSVALHSKAPLLFSPMSIRYSAADVGTAYLKFGTRGAKAESSSAGGATIDDSQPATALAKSAMTPMRWRKSRRGRAAASGLQSCDFNRPKLLRRANSSKRRTLSRVPPCPAVSRRVLPCPKHCSGK
jgi:hypothetical protein